MITICEEGTVRPSDLIWYCLFRSDKWRIDELRRCPWDRDKDIIKVVQRVNGQRESQDFPKICNVLQRSWQVNQHPVIPAQELYVRVGKTFLKNKKLTNTEVYSKQILIHLQTARRKLFRKRCSIKQSIF